MDKLQLAHVALHAQRRRRRRHQAQVDSHALREARGKVRGRARPESFDRMVRDRRWGKENEQLTPLQTPASLIAPRTRSEERGVKREQG